MPLSPSLQTSSTVSSTPTESPYRLEGFTVPSLLSPDLGTRHSHLQAGHFLAAPTKMWVEQRRSWEKQINTSSFQLGLEIRAGGGGLMGRQAEVSQALHRFTLPSLSMLVLQAAGKPIGGTSKGTLQRTAGGRGRLSLLGMNLCRVRPDEGECDRSELLSQLRQWGGILSAKARKRKLEPRRERRFSESLTGSQWKSPQPLISCSGSPYTELCLVVTKMWPLELDLPGCRWKARLHRAKTHPRRGSPSSKPLPQLAAWLGSSVL